MPKAHPWRHPSVRAFVLVVGLLAIGGADTLAHVGGQIAGAVPLRAWVDPDTGTPVPASLLLVRDDDVHLERADGRILIWSQDELTEADRAVVDAFVARTRALNGMPSSDSPKTRDADAMLALAIFAGGAFLLLFYRAGTRGTALALRGGSAALIVALALACGGSSGSSNPTPTSPSPTPSPTPAPAPAPSNAATLAGYFSAFPSVRTRSDTQYLYVESDGLAAHTMMVGIRSWQQQVPLPMSFSGSNAFSIPLSPRFADQPISGRTALFRGAIALAVNGVPIFNALNNRGDDAYLAGELDDFGGHAGRADDYHYHTAPLHLQSTVGSTNPIAVALDGFAIYGAAEPAGAAGGSLDQYNGHGDSAAAYHYHGTTTYPYINGGMRGAVTVSNDQIEPQPTTPAIRPAGTPLNGATITSFRSTGTNAWSLEYRLNNATYRIDYRIEGDTYTFVFVDPSGTSRTETYRRS